MTAPTEMARNFSQYEMQHPVYYERCKCDLSEHVPMAVHTLVEIYFHCNKYPVGNVLEEKHTTHSEYFSRKLGPMLGMDPGVSLTPCLSGTSGLIL